MNTARGSAMSTPEQRIRRVLARHPEATFRELRKRAGVTQDEIEDALGRAEMLMRLLVEAGWPSEVALEVATNYGEPFDFKAEILAHCSRVWVKSQKAGRELMPWESWP
jgi:hypothetical protein